ncbi:MAG: TIR domain-containing protein [Pseudomonadota bacterium]
MPQLNPYRIFVSHAWSYNTSYSRFINMLTSARYFSYRNYSVPVSKAFVGLGPYQLQEQLRKQIRPTQVVIVLAGMYTNHSNWIDFEIDFAESLNKPILAVRPWAALRTPTRVVSAANEIVSWNTSSIVSAIRRLA